MDTVAKHKVVTLEYELYNASGELLEKTGDQPLVYIHGIGQLLPALEAAVEGLSTGDTKEVTLTPEEGFGEYREDQVQRIPRSAFGDEMELEPGMTLYARTEAGDTIPFMSLEVTDEDVVADFNHPLAGETLTFKLKVLGIRDATPEELAHGHVHGPEGHAH